jgi:hypothetical protein
MFRSSNDHHQGVFWSWLKSLVKIWVFKCGYAAAYAHARCKMNERMLPHNHMQNEWTYAAAQPQLKTHLLTSDFNQDQKAPWRSKHVGVILSVLVCDIWINFLIQTSALVGPLYIVNWNARWNSEKHVTRLSLVTSWTYIGGGEVQLQSFLTSALSGREWSPSYPGRFIPGRERLYPSNRTHWQSAGPLWTFGKRKK